MFSGGTISVDDVKGSEGYKENNKLLFFSFGSKEGGSNQLQTVTDALKASGMNAHFYVSPQTAHEWQTWRRSLYQFSQLVFK